MRRPETDTSSSSSDSTPTLRDGTGDNTALLAQQLQLVETFNGVNSSEPNRSFKDWLEQFEAVASTFGWSDRGKQMALTTRLRGPALDYYRTCPVETRDTYEKVKECMLGRFVPVRLRAVQSCLFSERRQKSGEVVDEYAQDLRRLFSLAYPGAASDDSAEGKMCKLVLASQFAAGLRTELKEKLTGVDGDIEQLLVRAKFEEAKRRELRLDRGDRSRSGTSANTEQGGRAGTNGRQSDQPHDRGRQRDLSQIICHHCGGKGHIARSCPLKRRADPREAPGKREGSANMKELSAHRTDGLDEELATLKTLGVHETAGGLVVGPRVETDISIEGLVVKALIDTGSPVTIMSSTCFFQVCKNRTPEGGNWKDTVRSAKRKPSVALRAYGDGQVQVDAEADVTLSRGSYQTSAAVLVQCQAPQELLLGTDLLGALGVRIDLGSKQPVKPPEASSGASAAVKLLEAVRIPARHARVVRAEVDRCDGQEALMLVEPQGCGVELELTLVQPDQDGAVTLTVKNEGLQPIVLERGQMLGCADTVELAQDFDLTDSDDSVSVSDTVNILSTPPELTEDRKLKLCAVLRMDETVLTLEQRDRMLEMLLRYHDTFALDDSELGVTQYTQHRIETGDEPPIRQYARRIPYSVRGHVTGLVDEMLRREVIRPSSSPWASPVVLVRKKDDTYRFCVDYRRLNAATKSDVYPLPRIDDYLDTLAGARYFTTLDLASGYWQVAMEPQSIEKTTFVTHTGSYEFLVMPFGLKNAPATFQRLMGKVLAGLPQTVCMDYIDDILVVGNTFERHLENLEAVLQRLQAAGLKLKTQKCAVGRREVMYLGYVISPEGIRTDPKKTHAVTEFPTPTNVSQLRSFVGLTSYYRRFIKNYARIARPLHALTGKNQPYVWTGECQAAFEELKRLLTMAPVLVFPDFKCPFILETDASLEGLGAVLAQRKEDGMIHPVSYASRTVQGAEKRYASTEMEALAVIWAVRHYRHYLYGHSCTVFTDNQALKSLLRTPQPSGKLARWGMTLQELDLTIEYRTGKANGNADALSRNPVDVPLPTTPESEAECVLEDPTSVIQVLTSQPNQDVLARQQEEDPDFRLLMQYLTQRTLPEDPMKARKIVAESPSYEMVNGTLFRVMPDKTLRTVVPVTERKKLFEEVHGGTFGAHQREIKTHFMLSRHYWWPTMRPDIHRWSRACDICCERRAGPKPHVPLTPIPVAGPWDRVGVDVLQLPRSDAGNRYLIVFIDYLTKWVEAFATPNQTSLTIARLLVENVVTRHGVPNELLSDRGTNFLSKLMAEVYRLLGVKKVNTTAYIPPPDRWPCGTIPPNCT